MWNNCNTYIISVTALLVGEKLPPEAEIDVSHHVLLIIYWVRVVIVLTVYSPCVKQNDPFKLKTGGVVDMKKVKDRNRDM